MEHLNLHCQYLSRTFDFPTLRKDARKALRGIEFDTIVGRGLSGALVIPRLADAFGCKWLMVRKPAEQSHSSWAVEGHLGRRWLFVDDLIDSGETYRIVKDSIAEQAAATRPRWETEHVGAWLYDTSEFTPA